MADQIWLIDNPPSTRYPLYTRGNVGEVFPDVVAPLSWTGFGIPGAEQGWRDAFERFGAFDRSEFSEDQIEILGCFGGYAYLNVSIARIFGVRCPGLTPELVDFSIFGEQSDAPPYEPRPGDESETHTARCQATMDWIFSATELPELRADQERVAALRAKRPDFDEMSNEDLVRRGRDLLPMFRELYAQHIYTSYSSIVALGMVSFFSAAALGDPTLAMRLVAGIGGVDSAEPSYAMWDLARAASETPAVNAEFESGPDDLLGRLRATDGAEAWLERFQGFIDRFGSRGPNEWESRSPTWETQPALALSAIDRMRVADPGRSPEAHRVELVAEREALTADVLGRLEGDMRTQMGSALGAARLFMAGRERSKTTIVKFIHELRVMWVALGRRMVERGVFERPENFGMLRDDEFDDFLDAPEKWKDTIVEREALFSKLQGLVPPFIVNGQVPPLETWSERTQTPDHTAAGGTLQGIPGCPGEATGTARVVRSPHDPRGLGAGDILVAPITDPAWTPLFVSAAAVVVDVGAQLSHAVIVARELGIPCVVSVTNATRRIPDGAQVKVDGTNGTVTVL